MLVFAERQKRERTGNNSRGRKSNEFAQPNTSYLACFAYGQNRMRTVELFKSVKYNFSVRPRQGKLHGRYFFYDNIEAACKRTASRGLASCANRAGVLPFSVKSISSMYVPI